LPVSSRVFVSFALALAFFAFASLVVSSHLATFAFFLSARLARITFKHVKVWVLINF
jgi:hypothetical protein